MVWVCMGISCWNITYKIQLKSTDTLSSLLSLLSKKTPKSACWSASRHHSTRNAKTVCCCTTCTGWLGSFILLFHYSRHTREDQSHKLQQYDTTCNASSCIASQLPHLPYFGFHAGGFMSSMQFLIPWAGGWSKPTECLPKNKTL